MRTASRDVVLAVVLAALAGCDGCDRKRPAPARDSGRAATLPAVVDSAPQPAAGAPAWDERVGAVIVVRGSGAAGTGDAAVVLPQLTDSTIDDARALDAPAARNVTLDLFDRHGLAGTARIAAVVPHAADSDCVDWPTAVLDAATPGASLPLWNVALVGGRVEAVPLDSIEALPRPDSARLAAEATRLASALPSDTAAAFRGIPFLVRAAYRFTPQPGTTALVANIVRTLNQEATPRQEQILLVAESSGATAPFRTVYFERTSDLEDNVVATEVLAAFTHAGATPPRPVSLILARAGSETVAYALLERDATGHWRVRWTSATTGC